MQEVLITEDMINKATDKAKQMGKLNNSITKRSRKYSWIYRGRDGLRLHEWGKYELI